MGSEQTELGILDVDQLPGPVGLDGSGSLGRYWYIEHI